MVRVGILGAAGYTGGELIRLLINHPQAEIVFANSESNAGNLICDVHEGLMGETDMRFTAEMPSLAEGYADRLLLLRRSHPVGGCRNFRVRRPSGSS